MFSIVALGIFFILAPIYVCLVWMLVWTIVGMIYYGICWLLVQLKVKVRMSKYDVLWFNLYATIGVSFWKYKVCDAEYIPIRYMIGGFWLIVGLYLLFVTNQTWIINSNDKIRHPVKFYLTDDDGMPIDNDNIRL